MTTRHTVQPGEGIARIAWAHGFFPGTLWDHPGNAGLRAERGLPEVLLPSDAVEIPLKEHKTEAGDTGQKHVFRMHGVPAKFQLRLLRDGEPRADEPFVLLIDGKRTVQGRTDADGWIRCGIMPDSVSGLLRLAGGNEVYRVRFGGVDPISALSGVQSRLRALGYLQGASDGAPSNALHAAVAAFQEGQGLPVSGEVDEATRSALQAAFGS